MQAWDKISHDTGTAAAPLLAAIEAGIAENLDPAELAVLASELADRIDRATADWPRFLLCRGIIENRLALSETALATLLEARQLASRSATHLKPRISRAIAVVHTWRGRSVLAALELLQATAQAHGLGESADAAFTIAEAGRLNLELGRPDAAVEAFEAIVDSPALTPIDRGRAIVNLMQALNQVGRHAECLTVLRQAGPALHQHNTRLRLLSLLEEVRALAATGDPIGAAHRLEWGRELIGSDETAWEWFEWGLVAAEVQIQLAPETAKSMIEQIADRCREDELWLREARASLLLARISREMGEPDSFRTHAAAALRIAMAEGHARLIERAKSALLEGADDFDATRRDDGAAAQPALLRARYAMGEVLGRGGFGTVRRAIDLESGAELAIKMVDLSRIADPARRATTLRDARAELAVASQVRHPSLVRIHAGFLEGETVVIVQDRIVGCPIGDKDLSSWTRAELLQLFAQIAHALGALHAAGLVHRDIKPDNVMLTSSWQPIIIDFGLAEAKDVIDPSNTIRGTKGYAAPELTRSSGPVPADPRQDMYAFGVMLKQALAQGAAPVQAPRLFRRITARFRDPLHSLTLQLTAPDPRHRPTSMRDVARFLEGMVK